MAVRLMGYSSASCFVSFSSDSIFGVVLISILSFAAAFSPDF